MRALARVTCFVVLSSGTVTCLARAEPTSPAPPPAASTDAQVSQPIALGLVDPWRDEEAPVDRIDQPLPQREIVLIDPWTGGERSVKPSFEMIEVIDPWQDGQPRRIPTASFPLVDPWR